MCFYSNLIASHVKRVSCVKSSMRDFYIKKKNEKKMKKKRKKSNKTKLI